MPQRRQLEKRRAFVEQPIEALTREAFPARDAAGGIARRRPARLRQPSRSCATSAVSLSWFALIQVWCSDMGRESLHSPSAAVV